MPASKCSGRSLHCRLEDVLATDAVVTTNTAAAVRLLRILLPLLPLLLHAARLQQDPAAAAIVIPALSLFCTPAPHILATAPSLLLRACYPVRKTSIWAGDCEHEQAHTQGVKL